MTKSPSAPGDAFVARVHDNIMGAVMVRSFTWEQIAEALGITARALFERRRTKKWSLRDLALLGILFDMDPAEFSAPRP